MATPDAYDVLATAMSAAVQPLRVRGEGMVRLATVENQRGYDRNVLLDQRNYSRSLIEDQRSYNENREERIRSNRKTDAEEERLRLLRNQLSALMPPGTTVPADITEEDASREISRLTRERVVKYDNEDKDRALAFEITKLKELDEASLRREAELHGVEGAATSKDLEALRQATASKKAEEQIRIQSLVTNQQITAAKSSQHYAPLRQQLANLMSERGKVMGQSTLPEPIFDPEMTEQESIAIYGQIASLPEVVAALGNDPKKDIRLQAFRAGDWQQALSGMKPEERELLAQTISSKHAELQARLSQIKVYEHSKSVQAYIQRLREMPATLGRIDARIESLYDVGAKSGINFGLALRTEDPDEMAQIGTMSAMSAPGGMGGGAAAVNPVTGPVETGGLTLPTADFAVPQDVSGAAPKKTYTGLIPMLGDAGRSILSDPLISSGASDFSSGVLGLIDGAGQTLYSAPKAGLIGGEMPAPTPVMRRTSPLDLLMGPAKVGMGIFNAGGNLMRDVAIGLGGVEPNDEDILRITGSK